MYKNTAAQQWVVFAFQDEGGANPGEPVAGDALNITANVRIDAGGANAVDDTNPAELEGGYYSFGITAAESNGDSIIISPVSGTANVNVIGVPGAVYTRTDVSGVEAKIDLAQLDLDAITDTDGVILGAAGVDLIWDEVINGADHNTTNTSGRRIRELRESGFYSDGFIYIDTLNGADDETNYEAGTEVNPTSTIAHANAIATSLNLHKFKVSPGSTFTLAAPQVKQEFVGTSWTLALGGQDISNTTFRGAVVSGVGTTATGEAHFHNCEVGTTTLGKAHMENCGLESTLTLSAADTYLLDECYSAIAGSASPVIDFGAAVGNTALNMRHYSGGIQIDNKDGTGTDTMSLEGNGQLVVAASSSGAISVRGNFNVTNTGVATITYDDNTANTAAVLADTVGLQLGVIYGVAEAGTLSTTICTSDLSGYLDDELIGRVIIFTGGAADGQASDITDYASAAGTVTFTAIPTLPSAGDTFKIV